MAEQSPDCTKLYFEQRHRHEEEQRKYEEAKHRREAAEQSLKEAQHRREEAERKYEEAKRSTRKTTLPEFLNACHNHVPSNITAQTDATLPTRDDPTNATNNLRPQELVLWEDFPAQQAAIWDALMESEFASERQFLSLHTLEQYSEHTPRLLDLDRDDPITTIIERMYNQQTLRQTFGLNGFENHANTLSSESQLEEGIGSMTVSGAQQRRSPRLRAPSFSPRAGRFCVYNISTQNTETRVAAYITKYKPPYKLSLGCIHEGLEDMKLDNVVQCRETDTPRDHSRRLIAAVITQVFSCMVKLGVVYGCVYTGEVAIFLRVPDDPRTVHYFLTIPKRDVGGATGWAPDSDGANRLHLTAAGQMLAFTLQALKTPPRSHEWRVQAASQLNSWEVVYEDLLMATIPIEDLLKANPVEDPQRHTPISSSSAPPQDQNAASDEESDFGTPSRRQPSYCTQNCLLGLAKGGPLDMACPNVRDHGQNHHQIDGPTFLIRIQQQLSDDLDTDFEPVSRPSACGVLFRVRLKSHGYTVAAKCTPIHFVHYLQHEADVYDLLCPIQGIHVPVHLGNIDLVTPYYYEGICKLVHIMFLSFGGKPISHCLTTWNRLLITEQLDYSTQIIHNLGVLHRDLKLRNILWNEETDRVMVIDFEHAEVVKPCTVPGVISPNRKMERGSAASMAKRGGKDVISCGMAATLELDRGPITYQDAADSEDNVINQLAFFRKTRKLLDDLWEQRSLCAVQYRTNSLKLDILGR
ncbi:hypothetical protein GQ44DRAFT_773500 [Phaeosphaeriaceae sp. PMI808]|nr:hypothetical protein GQ44DRAFT_773500 [Phaeosphaeriaceae sp. PMI808]